MNSDRVSLDIKDFKAGVYRKQFHYSSFMPAIVDHRWIISDSTVVYLLSHADRKLGELNAFSQLVPDVDFFIRMHVRKEATTSSRIEGTRRTSRMPSKSLRTSTPKNATIGKRSKIMSSL